MNMKKLLNKVFVKENVKAEGIFSDFNYDYVGFDSCNKTNKINHSKKITGKNTKKI
ncbi:MAG: hypothetical protein J5582_04745 [Ruminococcus sp.]|uniref:hypothetical protein n=1 Tax=Ruminococcus sp. TaxID=41978 RepID=UPI0025EFB35A|nr:hypothetical protein [Ruminococcus sp.]MBO4865860.1 hypothetical protein [Ruminococcus sp.]